MKKMPLHAQSLRQFTFLLSMCLLLRASSGGAGLRGRRLSRARDGPMQSVSKRGARAPRGSLQEGPEVLLSLFHRHFNTKIRIHDYFLKHLSTRSKFAVQADVQLYAKLEKVIV